MQLSFAEENYLKAIYHLSEAGQQQVTTNAIAAKLKTKPASVSDMVQKLSDKGVLKYVKYKGANITIEGKKVALNVIRKHRLWEVFLVEKLNFNWDEVHEVAEQLEHIKSPLLIKRLDTFLGHPQYDPHGDPIPDENGMINVKKVVNLSKLQQGSEGILAAVKDSTPLFLQYMDKIGAYIGSTIKVEDIIEYDGSFLITLNNEHKLSLSREVVNNLLISS